MKIQLKPKSPDRVEAGLGPRVYLFERGKQTEILAGDWPELERQGYVEVMETTQSPEVTMPPQPPNDAVADDAETARTKKK